MEIKNSAAAVLIHCTSLSDQLTYRTAAQKFSIALPVTSPPVSPYNHRKSVSLVSPMQLEAHIAHLLKHHNCVIVPEFGGFIANYESAWINRQRSLIFPPYKQILFNGNLTQNDGLLANELVLKAAVSYSDALAKISMQVKDWRNQLNEGRRIELEEIGFLFLQNNQVVFEQNREVNLLLQAYGLKQVSFVDFSVKPALNEVEKVITTNTVSQEKPLLKVVEKERPKTNKGLMKQPEVSVANVTRVTKDEAPVIALNSEEEIEAVASEQKDSKIIPLRNEKKRSGNYKYAVAAAVILPVMFYAYWIPMKTDFLDTGKIQLSDFNPFNKQSGSVYQKRESAFQIDLTTDWKSWDELTAELPTDIGVFRYELNEETYISVRMADNESDGEHQSAINTGSFNLIAGCFSVEANANKLVADLSAKGYAAGIVDQKNGLFRVSAGSYATESDAELAKDKFQQDGFSGWVLKP